MDVCRTTEPVDDGDGGRHRCAATCTSSTPPLPWSVVDDEIISEVAVSIEEEEEQEEQHDETADGIAVGAPNGEHG